MQPIKTIFFILGIIVGISACVTPPDYPLEPEIEFISLSKLQVMQGNFVDTTILTFSFTDGDGDLGSDSVQNISIIDNRTGFAVPFIIPVIPPQGNNTGISGEISVELYNFCCILPDEPIPCQTSTTFPRDTLTYDVYIEDQAGNRSNTITTSTLILRCD